WPKIRYYGLPAFSSQVNARAGTCRRSRLFFRDPTKNNLTRSRIEPRSAPCELRCASAKKHEALIHSKCNFCCYSWSWFRARPAEVGGRARLSRQQTTEELAEMNASPGSKPRIF